MFLIVLPGQRSCNINIHTLVYVLLYCFFPSAYYCHLIQTEPKLKNPHRIVVNYLIVPTWVSPLRSPGAFSGSHLGGSIHYTHAASEPLPGEIEERSHRSWGFRKFSLNMPNVVDLKTQRMETGWKGPCFWLRYALDDKLLQLFKSSCLLDNDSFLAKAHIELTAPIILRNS